MIGKIVKTSELNDRNIKLFDIAHQIAEQAFPQIWDIGVSVLHDQVGKQLTGDEILSFYSTLIVDLSSRFIVQMKVIADDDDTAYTLDDLGKTFFDGVSKLLKIQKPVTKAPSKELSEIKRLN